MRVADIMRTPAVTVAPETSVRDAARRLTAEAIGCLPVERDGRLVGIVTDRDLVARVLAAGTAPDTPVSRLMSSPVLTVRAADDIATVCRAFRRAEVHRFPVMEGGRIAGVVSVDDMMLQIHGEFSALLEPAARAALGEQPDR
ncbi:cyclic nucleotide-binding/CBS domain-containing protein [Streptomyces sp. HPF1205]|uniref:CBS domain-containing protein n=1 Tax=Streptomyces sp. HPF1205 TaxID=2873262 RepID=UPI001CED0B6D|nr:CBS domain-containing protein [Streptomyces sp. HPF1205]